MENNEKKSITIDNVEYNLEDFTQEQVMMYNHINDLDRKLSSARFNVDQLKVGQNAFIKLLSESLSPKQETSD